MEEVSTKYYMIFIQNIFSTDEDNCLLVCAEFKDGEYTDILTDQKIYMMDSEMDCFPVDLFFNQKYAYIGVFKQETTPSNVAKWFRFMTEERKRDAIDSLQKIKLSILDSLKISAPGQRK